MQLSLWIEENMDKEEFLQFRKCRREIIRLCYNLYDYDTCGIEIKWEIFSNNIKEILGKQLDSILYETYDNICKRNWIRVRDMLLCLDDVLRNRLKENCSEFQLWHDDIWEENCSLLKCNNAHLANKVLQIKDSPRIEVKAGGTESCIIRIHEKDTSFQLFSSENPWLEGMDRVALHVTQQHANIYQWGFNGGFLTGTMEERFPDADINVYVSNLDIFGAVLHNVYLADVLNNNKLHFFYDPTGLDFAKMASVSCSEGKNVFIIDEVERRAFMHGEIYYCDIKSCSDVNNYTVQDKVTVGEKIYFAINE